MCDKCGMFQFGLQCKRKEQKKKVEGRLCRNLLFFFVPTKKEKVARGEVPQYKKVRSAHEGERAEFRGGVGYWCIWYVTCSRTGREPRERVEFETT